MGCNLMNKYRQAYEGFLTVNNLESKEAYVYKQDVRVCERCDTTEKQSLIGSVLVHFVCEYCRHDDGEWDFVGKYPRIPITVEAMEAQLMTDNDEGGD